MEELEEQIIESKVVTIKKARVWPVSRLSTQGLRQIAVSGKRELFSIC